MSAGPDSGVDLWSAGADQWICASTASSSSKFLEKYRLAATPTDTRSFADRFRSPSASTSSAAVTKTLFESPGSESSSVLTPPDSAELPMRLKHVSTILPVAEAKRLRFVPPCACDFPPGIATVAQVQSCLTQTCVSDHPTQIVELLCLRRVPPTSLTMAGPKHRSRSLRSDILFLAYKLSIHKFAELKSCRMLINQLVFRGLLIKRFPI